jgi:hypothetical protein
MMMVLFQSRIIYMPGIPLGTRREKISDYASLCHGVVWKKGSIATDDGNTLATATATNGAKGKKELLVVYFQGLLPRPKDSRTPLIVCGKQRIVNSAPPAAAIFHPFFPVRLTRDDNDVSSLVSRLLDLYRPTIPEGHRKRPNCHLLAYILLSSGGGNSVLGPIYWVWNLDDWVVAKSAAECCGAGVGDTVCECAGDAGCPLSAEVVAVSLLRGVFMESVGIG